MNTEWQTTTLGEIAEAPHGLVDGPFGSNLPASLYTEFGIPVIRGNNLSLGEARFKDSGYVFVSDETARKLARSLAFTGDIIFTKKGTLGQTGLIPVNSRYSKYLLSSNQMKLRVRQDLADPLFVYYYVSSPTQREKIIRDSTVTGVPKTNITYLRQFPIRLPSLEEQRVIAATLGALDDKIELNRKMNVTLEAMALGFFKAWFIDFEPVQSKMEGQWRSGQSLPGLPANLYEYFPDQFMNSEIGEIPKGWVLSPLPEVIQVNPRCSLSKNVIAPYLNMANMPTEGHCPKSITTRPFGSGMKFMNGDTLVARITPCLENGKTAYVDFLESDQVGWGSTEYIVLRAKPPLPNEFPYLLARTESFRDFAIQNMTGSSGRQRVPATALTHFQFPTIPKPIAEHFGLLIGPLFERSRIAAEESRTLSTLRDTLLPKLISGELRVEETEQVAAGSLP